MQARSNGKYHSIIGKNTDVDQKAKAPTLLPGRYYSKLIGKIASYKS